MTKVDLVVETEAGENFGQLPVTGKINVIHSFDNFRTTDTTTTYKPKF